MQGGGKTAAGRYPLLNTIRGATLAVMVVYHALWDAVNLGGWELAWYDGWQGFVWQQAICWSECRRCPARRCVQCCSRLPARSTRG